MNKPSHTKGTVLSNPSTDPHVSFPDGLLLESIESDELENLIQVSRRIFSGGEPRGDEAFLELKQLNIQTILSVDGAQPDIERARRYGFRYVHVPIGYDGVEEKEAFSIVRVIRETTGNIYVHCHHGQHRGPVAAAIASMALGLGSSEHGLSILKVAGTSRDYVKLWRDVEMFCPPESNVVLPELVEVARVGDLAETMAKMDRVFDHLQRFQSNQWVPPRTHPDLNAKQLALILREYLHESGRLMDEEKMELLVERFKNAETEVITLQNALDKADFDRATALLNQIKHSCKTCHQKHRDLVGLEF